MPLQLHDRNLPDYLKKLGIADCEPLMIEPAGDGNINWVRRVREPVSGRSWIVKQARPALERFPQYQVSTSRIVFEARYYQVVAPLPVAQICPEILHFDERERVLIMEDLGGSERLDAALARGADVRAAARELGHFLGCVHAATGDASLAGQFDNHEMRKLHGDHIFELPLRENDFELPEALRNPARQLREDSELLKLCDQTYADYLESSAVLVHADVQPANVLLTAAGPKLLDAEIAHLGDPAFDLGVLLGHLALPAIAAGEPERNREACRAAWLAYAEAAGTPPRFERVARYAGIEILRRTIGAAQVPAVQQADAGLRVLEHAVEWIRKPPAAV